jgi:hypothetical protein
MSVWAWRRSLAPAADAGQVGYDIAAATGSPPAAISVASQLFALSAVTGGLAPGASAYFWLEGTLTGASLTARQGHLVVITWQ